MLFRQILSELTYQKKYSLFFNQKIFTSQQRYYICEFTSFLYTALQIQYDMSKPDQYLITLQMKKSKKDSSLKQQQFKQIPFDDDLKEIDFYQPSEQAQLAANHIDKIPKQEVALLFFYLIQKLPEKSKIDVLRQTLEKLQKSSLIAIFQGITKKFPNLELVKTKLQPKKLPSALLKKMKNMNAKSKKNNQDLTQNQNKFEISSNHDPTKIQESIQDSEQNSQSEEEETKSVKQKQPISKKHDPKKSKFIKKRGSKRQDRSEPFNMESYLHFENFMVSSYRLYPGKKKQNFMRRQPIYERYNTSVKTDCQKQKDLSLPLISLGTFRKFMKKYFKKNGMKYEEATNMYKMKVILSIGLKGGGNGESTL